ncbi:MAG TPA: hypothetical protein VJH24_05525 [Candidatus Bilamarchaeaceae archaeon]|nr:hypothetical protein [Candidatus Bilamarchaeaceae archaeon]
MYEKFKSDEKEKLVKKEPQKKQFTQLFDEEQTEIKRLNLDDVEDAVKVMRRCAFDVTEKEVEYIVKYGFSFGCYVNRMIVGVGLAWPTYYDPRERVLRGGDANALYLEDPAVLLTYEGRGIRRILVRSREKDARAKQLKYALTYVTEDLPKGSVDDYIKERSSQLEKLYQSEDYQFYKSDRGLLAMKELA